MGILIVDCSVMTEVDANIDFENQIVEFTGASKYFKHEKKFMEDLIKAKSSGIYPHLIVNYHNTYHFRPDNSDQRLDFVGCLPLGYRMEKRGKMTLILSFALDKVTEEYLNKYTEKFNALLEKKKGKKNGSN